MTTAQIRASLAGKASDAAITAVINAVDRNKDGIITAEESQAAKIIANATQRTTSELQAIYGQGLTFTNAITGQTASITGTQDLTNDELNTVQSLQNDTVNITELVQRAVEGNESLSAALLIRLSSGISVSGIGQLLTSNTGIMRQLELIRAAIISQIEAQSTAENAAIAAARQNQINALTTEAQQVLASISQLGGLVAAAEALFAQTPQSTTRAEQQWNSQGENGFSYFSIPNAEYPKVRAELEAAQLAYANTKDQLSGIRLSLNDLGIIPSFDGGGYTGLGSRSGGMDGKGGFLSMLHPNETVIDHSQRKMSRGNSGSMDAKALREEVAELRRVMVEVVKYVKRTSEVNRKWDIDGAPAVRT